MIAATFRLLLGAFTELCQLLLVLVSAVFGTKVATGRGLLPVMIVYSLLAWLPARDLVEGWLGMVARRLPDRYEDRAENVGRGVMAIAFSIAFIVLLLVLPSDYRDRRGAAFETTYGLFALSIFGLGGAIPRLWFGLRASAWTTESAVPQLLREAGKRGALFITAAFVSIGIAFTTAYALGGR
jgi:hypothetical protein